LAEPYFRENASPSEKSNSAFQNESSKLSLEPAATPDLKKRSVLQLNRREAPHAPTMRREIIDVRK